MSNIKLDWIIKGYRTFAYEGPQGLKVERLARQVKKNKSSFYHLFSDLELFIVHLLEHHTSQGKIMAEKEALAQRQEELIEILLEHKIDLLFNRQLRIHRENKDFEKCFNDIAKITLPATIPVWKKVINLPENAYLAEAVLHLSLENFLLQINDETLNHTWLNVYFDNIRSLVNQFKHTKPITKLDGTV